jgi:Tfp pilus assembly protein PilF
VSLPVVLLVLNVYPYRRLGEPTAWRGLNAQRVYRELTPFALLSGAFVILSIVALHPPAQLSVGGKLAVSAYGLCFYLLKTIVPVRLSPLYPMPSHVAPMDAAFLASYAGVAVFAVVIWLAHRRFPSVSAALLVFTLITLPMLGIVQNGPQITADRYTYHAAPALAILVGGVTLDMRRWRMTIRVCAGVAIALLAILTWNQTLVWRDSSTLWARVLDLHPESALAQTGYANELMKSQDSIPEAFVHYERAIALEPESADNEDNFGAALANANRSAEAIQHYQRALQLRPSHAAARDNWARAESNVAIELAKAGRLAEAEPHFRQAVALEPMLADVEYNWGYALMANGHAGDAIAHFKRAVDLKPGDAGAHCSLARALLLERHVPEAVAQLQETLRIDPENAEARQYLEGVHATFR